MKNPFSIKDEGGFQWWTCGAGRKPWPFLKVGPITFSSWENKGKRCFEVMLMNRWVRSFPKLEEMF